MREDTPQVEIPPHLGSCRNHHSAAVSARGWQPGWRRCPTPPPTAETAVARHARPQAVRPRRTGYTRTPPPRGQQAALRLRRVLTWDTAQRSAQQTAPQAEVGVLVSSWTVRTPALLSPDAMSPLAGVQAARPATSGACFGRLQRICSPGHQGLLMAQLPMTATVAQQICTRRSSRWLCGRRRWWHR